MAKIRAGFRKLVQRCAKGTVGRFGVGEQGERIGLRAPSLIYVFWLAAMGSGALAQGAGAPSPSAIAAAPPASASTPAHAWQQVPRLVGRLKAAELGLIINSADPASVEVGEYYAQHRGIPEAHVLRVSLPVRARLTAAEFETLDHEVRRHFGAEVQALAMAWSQPYAVECNSITSALSLGFDASVCSRSCAPTKPSRYFNYAGTRPWKDLGMRPSMLLAARSPALARELIDRGLSADFQLGLRGALPARAYFVATPDRARNVREPLFPPAGILRGFGVEVLLASSQALPPMTRTLLYQTGLVRVAGLDAVSWLPGALADHLTSFGGELDKQGDPGAQMTALAWLESGATASYGTVSEPCNHQQKFPHPQRLLLSYMQGVTALEAYWRSVAWPAQGLFVGEPLAAPFARPSLP
jgi:uncharacterized protein (TIGR03790 family)